MRSRYGILVLILSILNVGFFMNLPKEEEIKDVKVDIKTCFGDRVIKSGVTLEDYLVGVLYAEENPTSKTSKEYLKAFVIFARTYSLKRGKYKDLDTHLSIKSCSSDQNWCDYEFGCYREQTEVMFNECINFSLNKNSKKPYYSAKTCANRVTTFPGTKNVSNKTFTVNNSRWPKGYKKSAKSTTITSKWKGKPNDKYAEFLKSIVKETEGLVLKDQNGNILNVGYMVCNSNTSNNIMCMNKAKNLGNKGYTSLEIIKAFTKKYKDIKIEDYRNI